MRRLTGIIVALAALLLPQITHAQQFHIYCNVATQTPCTPTSKPLSTGDQVVTAVGKTEAMFSQWFGVSGLVKSNGPSAAPTAATAANVAAVIGVTGIPVLSPSTAAAATASDVATTVNGFLQPRTAAEISAGVTPASLAYPMGDVRRYGAVGDGVTDDSGAIQNALNVGMTSSNRQPVLLAAGANYRLASGITIPPTVYVYGQGASPDSNVGWSTRLTCDLAVATCVTIGQSGGSPGAGLAYVSVWRAAGTIPASSIGIKVLDGGQVAISHVSVMRHSIGVYAKGDGAGGALGLTIDDLHVGIVNDAYFVDDSWAEIRIINSRFGTNGNDIAANTYVRFQGGSASQAGAGPNTFYVSNTQFNASPTGPTHWLDFVNQTPANIGALQDFKFANVHVENIPTGGSFIHSDATWTSIIGLAITNSWFSPDNSGTSFLALNSATVPADWHISHNNIAVSITLAPGSGFGPVELTGNNIGGNVSVTGVGSTHYTSIGNYILGTLTYAGNFQALRSDDQVVSTFTSTATGSAYGAINFDGSSFATGSWTPGLSFGGGTTGITYSNQGGTYRIVGPLVCVNWTITLTSKGSSTGFARLTGLPLPVGSGINSSIKGNGGSVTAASNMASLPASVLLQAESHALTTAFIGDMSATGTAALADTNFTNTSSLSGQMCYEWQ